jgi:hypothetical protein
MWYRLSTIITIITTIIKGKPVPIRALIGWKKNVTGSTMRRKQRGMSPVRVSVREYAWETAGRT